MVEPPREISAKPVAQSLPLYTRRFRRWHRWIVVAIFLLSLLHRLIGVGTLPAPGATNDEYFYLWTGMSMMSGHAPRAWTQLEVSPDTILGTYNGRHVGYTIVQPAFDHPPTFELLAGATGKLAGATPFTAELQRPAGTTTLWDVSLARLRLLPLALYAFSFWLLWGWLRISAGPAVALLAVTLFGFLQHAVIHHRLVVADNMVTPMLLAALYTLERWRRTRLRAPAAAAFTIGTIALAVSSKLVALSAVAAIFGWAGSRIRGRDALRPCTWAIAGAAAGLAILLIFAAIFGFSHFLVTMRSQAVRFYDLGGVLDAIRHQPIIHESLASPWLTGAWLLAALGLVITRGAHRAVYTALIGYAFAYVFFAPVDLYGWHLLPFMPFLCAAWATALRHAWRHPSAPATLLIMLLLAAAGLNALLASAPDLRLPVRYAYVALAVLMLFPWGFQFDTHRRTAIRLLIIALLLIGLSQEITQLIALQLHTEVTP